MFLIKKIQRCFTLPILVTLGFTASVRPRKQSSDSVPKSHRFNSRFGPEKIQLFYKNAQNHSLTNIPQTLQGDWHAHQFHLSLERDPGRTWNPCFHLNQVYKSERLFSLKKPKTDKVHCIFTWKKGCCSDCSAVGLLCGSQEQSCYLYITITK